MKNFEIFFGTLILCFATASAVIKCYNCTSETDDNCNDPFDKKKLEPVACTVVNPSAVHLNVSLPIVCRKTIIKAYAEHVRIIRGCASIPDNREEGSCFQRSGSKDVSTTYCACSEDGCNPATSSKSSLLIVLTSLLTALFIKFLK